MTVENLELLDATELDSIVNPPVERRGSSRIPFRTAQTLAPIRRGVQGSFRDVNCSDISTSGISFLLDYLPDFDRFALRIGTKPIPVKLIGEVVGIEAMKGLSLYLVRCRFINRLDSGEECGKETE